MSRGMGDCEGREGKGGQMTLASSVQWPGTIPKNTHPSPLSTVSDGAILMDLERP